MKIPKFNGIPMMTFREDFPDPVRWKIWMNTKSKQQPKEIKYDETNLPNMRETENRVFEGQ